MTLALAFLAGPATTTQAGSIFVPNGSFESPSTVFAGPELSAWQKASQPLWYDASGGFPWDQLVGQFLNPAAGQPGHITNLDGRQAAFLFALPEVAIFQDLATPTTGGRGAGQPFQAQFEAGKAYTLSVDVLGGGGGMTAAAALELALYYRDVAGRPVTVAATVVSNTPGRFPDNSAFTTFQVRVPRLRPDSAAAGKFIGIRIASLVDFDRTGGYWDIDDVRLAASPLLNESFESPAVEFAGPALDGWRKAPEPVWYDPSGGFAWDQLTGQFVNPPVGQPGHLENLDGGQAAFLFALPEVAILQDAAALTAGDGAPARFRPGHAYSLTVGVLGGGGGMRSGVPLALSLYYTNAGGRVPVATTLVSNSASLFPSNTRLTDFHARVPRVEATDPWAGHNIGIEIASAVDFTNLGGYWDIDHVRLCESVVANPSFESPVVEFADPRLDGWQKAPQPLWYDPNGEFAWEQLSGQFQNPPFGAPNRLVNVDGSQAAFLFALPDNALFQDGVTLGGGTVARFEPGRGYNLTVAVVGGGGNMAPGVTLALRVYYRTADGQRVSVASTTITNSPDLFPSLNRLVDFNVVVPVVRPGDPWAGRPVGVEIASTVDFERLGGYWDLDNVRLTEFRAPWLRDATGGPGGIEFTLDSAPGRYEVLTTSQAGAPAAAWTSWRTMTNITGTLILNDTPVGAGPRFYRARPIP